MPWGRHWCASEIGHHLFRSRFVASSASSHYLTQCWHIVNRAVSPKYQWKLKQYAIIFIGNAFVSVVCKISAILFRPISFYSKWWSCNLHVSCNLPAITSKADLALHWLICCRTFRPRQNGHVWQAALPKDFLEIKYFNFDQNFDEDQLPITQHWLI